MTNSIQMPNAYSATQPVATQVHPREKLVSTAAALVHQQGWTATGINQILSEAGIPKGSFYYYFRSKEALGAAVLQHHYSALKQLLAKTLLNTSLTADVAIYELLKELVTQHRDTKSKLGCPIGSFANEIATQSSMLLDEANLGFKLYEDSWTAVVQRGQQTGAIAGDLDPAELGKVASMLLQGAFLSMKASGSIAPIVLAHSMIHNMLFKNQATLRPIASEYNRPHALAS